MNSAHAQPVTDDEALDRVFGALSDRTRRALLRRLADGPARVTELAEPFDISLPAVSRHIKVLEEAGLIAREVDGRVHRCSLDAEAFRTAEQWLAFYRRFWVGSLDALADFLEEDGA